MSRRIRRPSPATVIASLALVVAMSGTAVAATALHSGDALIAKRTLSGNRLRVATVTGREIKESSLGTVPRAARAATLPALVWHPLHFINGWTNANGFESAGWAIDAQGVVHFRGQVVSGTAYGIADGLDAIAPTASVFVPGRVEYPSGPTHLRAEGNGFLALIKGTGLTGEGPSGEVPLWIDLNALSYPVKQK